MTAVIEEPSVGSTSIRSIRPGDRTALLEMYERCSAATRYHRWHGRAATFPWAYLNAILHRQDGQVAIVASRDEQIVALASMAQTEPGALEIAILVEDRWQRQGLGRELASRLVAIAREDGAMRVRAEILSEDAGLTRLLGQHGPTSTGLSHGVLTATLELAGSR